ncbi:MAG: carboxy terminal-processing peptidase [Bacteroidota bacterium]|nr:carboxy terminal-processing peptidase [Bacteroidota bacterium]
MKKSVLIGLIGLLLSVSVQANDSTKVVLKTLVPESQHPVLFQLVGQILNSYHYRKVKIDDKLSSDLLDNYIENLDPGKVYFLKEDIQKFEKFRYQFDDDLLQGNVQKAFDIYNTYQTHLEDRIYFTLDLLKQDFNFSSNDSFEARREKADWPKNYKEYDALWYKKAKSEVLQLKADGKDEKTYKEILTKRYKNLLKQLSKTKNEDVYSYFANSLTELADPHTNYFSPRAAEDFNQSMSLNLEGIGAQLQTENEYTKIREIIKGGPAEKSKQLFANDKIVAVGQGKDGEMVNILDWRIDDVVSLIRGKKGTLVRLEIISHDAVNNKSKIIELVRDKILLEDQSAKCSVHEVTRNGVKERTGVIMLPNFYLDVAAMSRGDANYKSTTRDVKKLILQLKDSSIQSLVVDLRNNGGGSLQEAVELTGLFIKSGPVVQVKDAIGITKSEEDKDESITWDGPLAVLVNRFSASASEIFAAAIQDYNRGIIIGEKTYGKGTVQNLMDLNSFMMVDGIKLGQIKITIAKFYRISGGSTQFKGVIPDIEFPSIYADKEYGEEASKYALPYDEINPMKYTPAGNVKMILPELARKHEQRMKTSLEYSYLIEDIEAMKKAKAKIWYTLNEARYKNELETADKQKKEREAAKAKLKENKGGTTNLILDESCEILLDLMGK